MTVITAGLVLALAGPLLAEETRAGVRAELEDLRTTLESAASKGARGVILAGPRGGRAYYLKGYGGVLVLTPRVLPMRRTVTRTMVVRGGEVADALAAARRGLEESLARATAPQVREEIRRNVETLRATEAELRRTARVRPPRPPVVVAAPAAPAEEAGLAEVDLSRLEREMEAQMAAYAAALRGLEAAHPGWPDDAEREIRRHLRRFEEHAEAFRVQAERARRQLEQEVWTRLAPPLPPAPALPATPVTPAPPLAPVPPPAPVTPVTPSTPAAPAAPVAPPAPAAPPPLPAPPEWPQAPAPWRFWFDLPVESREVADEAAEPGPAVAAVREALAAGLASHSRPLGSLRPDDFVAVAVDFVPDGLLRARPLRTLVARVRARDLEDRRLGRISVAELRQRIEFDE